MKKRVTPKARTENIVVQQLDHEVLIYDLNTDKVFCLNESSAKIWESCDGMNDVSQISILLKKHFNSTVDENFVWLALEQLKKENLIENKEEIPVNFNGMTRREVIRKVGLASVIALPLIYSISAPPAAQAQSPTACNQRDCTPGASGDAQCATVGCGTCRQSGKCANP